MVEAATRQKTLQADVSCEGIGVHSGNRARLTFKPAEAGHGIRFVRTDLKNGARSLEALWDKVADTRLCTVLANEEGGKIGTVEHAMAALHAMGVDNATVEVDGPEVPIMDGSSRVFMEMIEKTGLAEQTAPQKRIVVLQKVEVVDGDRRASLSPSDEPSTRFLLTIDFAEEAIRRQTYDFSLSPAAFREEIGAARTFGFFEEGEQLRKLGLGRGCSLDNTVVIKDGDVMNEEGLRFENEFVRHKLLDAIGDLALAGAPIQGLFEGYRTGHAMNNRLLRALFAEPRNYRWA